MRKSPFIPFLLALLLLSAPLYAAKSESKTCRQLIQLATGHGETGAELAEQIRQMKVRRSSPYYYPLNLREISATPVEELLPSEMKFTKREVKEMEKAAFLAPPHFEPAFCTRVSSDLQSFEIADLLGRKVTYHLDGDCFRRVSFEKTHLPRRIFLDPARIKRNFKLPADLKALARQMTKNQLAHSENYQISPSALRRRITLTRTRVNSALLQKLSQGEAIRPLDLQTWARLINDNAPITETNDQLLLLQEYTYWVIRGTIFRYVENDLYEIEANLTGTQFTGSGIFGMVYFEGYRNSEVPAALDELLTKINSINHQTSFSEALLMGRDYLRIHPTINGNGRLGRSVFDFCLMKAGFPPVPALDPVFFSPYFRSDEDFIDGVLHAIASAD